jgi:hypothetical protein
MEIRRTHFGHNMVFQYGFGQNEYIHFSRIDYQALVAHPTLNIMENICI